MVPFTYRWPASARLGCR